MGDEEVTRFLNAWFEVRQFIQAANFNHFHQAGLSATQFMTLNLLPEDGGGLGIGELARRMNLKPATVARTVDTLEERGMLARAKSGSDGRRVLVQITKEGQKLQNAAAGQFRAQIAGVFGAIPAADRKALVAGLEALVKAAEATRDPGGAPRAKRNFPQSPRQ